MEKLSLKELCKELSISLATGKNWVKLGKIVPQISPDGEVLFEKSYLEKLKKDLKSGKNYSLKSRRNKKFVSGNKLYSSYVSDNSKNIETVKSLTEYIEKNNIAPTDTLISGIITDCALKLIKDKGENEKEYWFLIEDTDRNIDLTRFKYVYEANEDILGLLYISLKNMAERKISGSYFTPTKIVKKLCERLNIKKGKTVYDCCCGTGNFLLHLDTDFENIYGNDIDPLSVKISRINMAIKFGIKDKELLFSHITNYDFLSYEDNIRYDYIAGNPPWCADGVSGKYREIYDAVTDKALGLLKQNGVLSFVLPEAILNVNSHKKIRKVISDNNSIKYIEYLGEVFDGVQCPSVILQILHDGKPFDTTGMRVVTKEREFMIESKREISSDGFNFLINDEEYNILNKIENLENKVTLKDNSIFALGIVTGDNKKYISTEKTDKNEMVLRGANIHKFNYEPSNTYITFIPDKFQQVAPVWLYRSEEKLFYKFISQELVFAYDDNKTLSLNSCNILIPQIEGLDIKYVLAVLNSSVAQFYFKSKYNSVKVLRSHIESIPIPYVDKTRQRIFISYVDKILKRGYSELLFNQIDEHVADLFGLTREEYRTICLH